MNNVITCALPYANGNLHLGHLFEATCADIKSRYLIYTNTPHLFVSGDDCHGAATTLYCTKHNLDIPTHLNSQYTKHLEVYSALKIEFDAFGKTNTALHEKVVNWCVENIITNAAKEGNTLFSSKKVLSWFDESTAQFLPDRYVKGQCPHCGALGQSAEICESCSTPIAAQALIQPYNTLTTREVALKETTHLVLNTNGFYEELQKQAHLLPVSVRNKLLDNSLEKTEYLDISRDAPYYGIPIKHFPELANQFFYVWFDAPLGYITFSFEKWLSGQEPTKALFNEFCNNLVFEHFIGKDITYFHTFLWFNLIKYINPNIKVAQLNCHGWLTLDNLKFSKSLGHSVALDGLSLSQIDALRLYFFSKNDTSISDVSFEESLVAHQYNVVVVNNLANFYARSVKLAHKKEITPRITQFSIGAKYTELLDSCNYKKLFELVSEELAGLNSTFQSLALWAQSDKEVVEQSINELLNQWYEIYLVLELVCPSLSCHKHDILNGEFIHLAARLEEFSVLKLNNT